MNEPHPPPWTDRHLWQIRPVRDLLWIALGLAALLTLYSLRSIFLPVGIALVLAYIFNPVIDLTESRWSVPRAVAIVVILVLVLATGAGLLVWLGPVVAEQTAALVKKLPHYARILAERYQVDLRDYDVQIAGLIERVLREPIVALRSVFAGTSQAFGFIGGIISTTTYVVVTAFLLPIYFIVFALHFHTLTGHLAGFLPASRRDRTLALITRMDEAVSSFLRGRVIIAVVMAGLFAIGWSPLLTNVPYWLILSILTGVLSLIPFAAGLGWVLALLFKTLELAGGTGVHPWDWIVGLGGPTIVYGLVQFVEGWFLTPWIQSRSLDLNVVTVLIAVFVGAALGGLYGMILAIPVTACAKILLKETVIPGLRAWARQH